MAICRPILCLPWCSTSKVHLWSIFLTTEGRGLFTSALFWRIFGQIGPYCTTQPSVTPSTLPPKQNMHGGCPKSHALCPIFELDALVGTSMLTLNWQAEFGRNKRCSGSSKSSDVAHHRVTNTRFIPPVAPARGTGVKNASCRRWFATSF